MSSSNSKTNSIWQLAEDLKLDIDQFYNASRLTPVKCRCDLWAGCTCGVMDAEMKAKGYERSKFGPEKWVKIEGDEE